MTRGQADESSIKHQASPLHLSPVQIWRDYE